MNLKKPSPSQVAAEAPARDPTPPIKRRNNNYQSILPPFYDVSACLQAIMEAAKNHRPTRCDGQREPRIPLLSKSLCNAKIRKQMTNITMTAVCVRWEWPLCEKENKRQTHASSWCRKSRDMTVINASEPNPGEPPFQISRDRVPHSCVCTSQARLAVFRPASMSPGFFLRLWVSRK